VIGLGDQSACPFCRRLRDGPVDARLGTAGAFRDGFPIATGHTLVVPARHVADFFALTKPEQADVLSLTDLVREQLALDLRPDGFNIGINAGPAAGQTVDHAHVHVIPRFSGDVSDPRGGIRWVIPKRAAYWPPNDADGE
jgi:diadenosine tetraphosphate (Ap4A) HIT family hydrolase